MVKFTQEFQRCRKMPPSTFQHRQFYFQYSVMMDDGPKTQPEKSGLNPQNWTRYLFLIYFLPFFWAYFIRFFKVPKLSTFLNILTAKNWEEIIKNCDQTIWDIPYTALSGTTYVLGNQCIASLGSSSTVSFISSNVWNTRTNKAFKKNVRISFVP